MQAQAVKRYVASLVLVLMVVLGGCSVEPTPPPGATSTPVVGETPARPALSAPAEVASWPVYRSEAYGFQFAYPSGWVCTSFANEGPGMPEDWPVQEVLGVFPPEMAEHRDRSGPPDPNAPPTYPAVSVEVYVGPPEAFHGRVYPEPDVTEPIEVAGVTGVLEREMREDFNSYRYVFVHPQDPNVRIVFVDVVTGFSERAEAHPEYVEAVPEIVATLAFTGQPEPSDDTGAYRVVETPELRVEVPADWQRRDALWTWAPPGAPEGAAAQWVGVNVVDLEPPQEPEAVLLPQPAQVVASTEVDLGWAQGRSFTLEVYDAAGAVASMERHVVVTVAQDGTRRAYDLYAAGKTAELLEALAPVLEHMLASAQPLSAPDRPSDPSDQPSDAALAQIRTTVAERLDVAPEALDLALEFTEFPDACLGKAEAGEMCAQVITPGYIGEAQVDGAVYEVRATEDGSKVIVSPMPSS
jgi:hypothetical protein